MYRNHIELAGNLGADAEMRYLPNGTAVANFRMAVTRRYKTADGEQREDTNWFRCSLFGKQAEAVGKYLVKGKPVFVEGHVETRDWERTVDAPDAQGETHTVTIKQQVTEIRVREIQLLGSKADGERAVADNTGSSTKATGKTTGAAVEDMFDEDTPF